MRCQCSDEEMSRICSVDLADVAKPRIMADWPTGQACHIQCSAPPAEPALHMWSIAEAAQLGVTSYGLQHLGLSRRLASDSERFGEDTAAASAHPTGSTADQQLDAATLADGKRSGDSTHSDAHDGPLSLRAATSHARAQAPTNAVPDLQADTDTESGAERLELAALLGLEDEADSQAGLAPEQLPAQAADSAAGASAAPAETGDSLRWEDLRSVREQLEALCCSGDEADADEGQQGPPEPLSSGVETGAGCPEHRPLHIAPQARLSSGDCSLDQAPAAAGSPDDCAEPDRGASPPQCSAASPSLCDAPAAMDSARPLHGGAVCAQDDASCPTPDARTSCSPAEPPGIVDEWLANAEEATAAVKRAAEADPGHPTPTLSELCASVRSHLPERPVMAEQRSSHGGVAWSVGEVLPPRTAGASMPAYGRSPGVADHTPAVQGAAGDGDAACKDGAVRRGRWQGPPTSQALLRRLMRKKPTVRQIMGKDPPTPPQRPRPAVRSVHTHLLPKRCDMQADDCTKYLSLEAVRHLKAPGCGAAGETEGLWRVSGGAAAWARTTPWRDPATAARVKDSTSAHRTSG